MLVTVIIPTTCEAQRQASLLRAIDSVLSTQDVDVDLLLVVNGDRYDKSLFDQLRTRTDLRLHYQSVGSLPLALQTGRSLVRGQYFAFLDDDDEYLAGALSTRLEPFLRDPSLEVVVSNGDVADSYGKTNVPNPSPSSPGQPPASRRAVDDPELVNRDPLMALMAGCWLASCGGLFRTSAIPEHYFDGRTAFLEWTWLAFQLVLDKRKIQFIDSRTFRVNDSPQSLSRSNAALFGQVRVLSDMLRYRVPPAIRGELRRKRASALHSVAYHQVRSGNLGSAWAFHLASMAGGGWRYLSFTRHLLFGSLNSKAID